METEKRYYIHKLLFFLRLLIIFFIGSYMIFPVPVFAFDEGDLIVYRDREKRFSFHYPKSWKKVEATYQDTRFKIVSNNGKGAEDCGVNVKYDKNLEGVSSKYYSKNVAPASLKTLLDRIKTISPDARIVEFGDTSISNNDAYYFITTGTFRTLDYEAKITNFSVQTVKNGNVYTIVCRCPQEKFKNMRPVFKRIMTGFVFHN